MEKDRETIARELALAHGYEWDTAEEGVRDAWLKKADAVLTEEEAPGVCGKCGGRGFTEQEHGLVMELCDCEKGEALRAETTVVVEDIPVVSIGGGAEIPDRVKAVEGLEVTGEVLEIKDGDSFTAEYTLTSEMVARGEHAVGHSIRKTPKEDTNDSDSGTGQPDSDTGGGDTSQPKQPKKPKSKRKARKKSS